MTKIGITKLRKPYSLEDIVKEVKYVMTSSGMSARLSALPEGSRVLVKPNLVADLPAQLGATSDPRVVLGVCLELVKLGLVPWVAESSSIGVDTSRAFALEYDILNKYGLDYHALDNNPTICIGKDGIEIYQVVACVSAIISVPKLKTHDQTGVTLGIKNLKGLLPDSSKAEVHHNGLCTGIVNLYRSLSEELAIPMFAVADGLIGMEGLGPVYGKPKEMGLLIAGTDLTAFDAFCCGLMGFRIDEIDYLKDICCSDMEASFTSMPCISGQFGNITAEEAISRYHDRFIRAEEVLEQLSTSGISFDWSSACSGCRNTIMSVIAESRINGELLPEAEYAAGRCYKAGSLSGLPKVFVGNCAIAAMAHGNNGISDGIFVKGCPPVNEEINHSLAALRRDTAGE